MGIIFFRTIIIFFSLLTAMRLMGKRQLGEIELSELVVAVLISNVAAQPLQDISIPLINGLLPVIILLCCELIMSGIIVRSVKARELICGKPSILISNGTIDQAEMNHNRFTIDELFEELRSRDILDVSTVQYAVLETDGTLNTVLYPAHQPVTASQMGIESDDAGYPTILINGGRLLSENLKKCGRDENWLKKELKKRGVKQVNEVYLFTINSSEQAYFLKLEAKK